jgi:hypothetical protein
MRLNARPVKRGQRWVALLGANSRDGIAGFGRTVEAAFQQFDVRYSNSLKSPISRSERPIIC